MDTQTLTTPRAFRLWGSIILLFLFFPRGASAQSERLSGNIQNPVFSPSDRALVAYSRQVENTQELYLYDATESTVRKITAVDGSGEESGGAGGFFDTGTEQSLRRFEGQLAWRPVLDPDGRQWFVFVSSVSETGYGLFLSYLTPGGKLADRTIELPFQGQAGFPSWSPDGHQLVFSGSSEGAEGNELYLYPDVGRLLQTGGGPGVSQLLQTGGGMFGGDGGDSASVAPLQLTDNPAGSLYPAWSPNGQYIAYQSKQTGKSGRANWGISLLDLSTWAGPQSNTRPRTVRLSKQFSAYHEYKPSWSPNGSYVGFYVSQSRVGAGAGNRRQDIGVLQLVRGNRGRVQTGRLLEGFTGQRLAKNVLPNAHRGPGWHPSANTSSLIYVEKEENRGNPIYLADVARWSSDNSNYSRRLSTQFEGETRLHEAVDATRGAEGLRLAFASQEGERLRLQIRDALKPTYSSRKPQVKKEVSRTDALWRSAAFPGWGQFRKGDRRQGLILAAAGGVTLATVVVTGIIHQNKVSDYNNFVDKFGPSKYMENDPATFFKGGDRFRVVRFEKFRSKYEDASSAPIRNIAVAAFAGVWAWSLYDSYRGFPTSVNKPIVANEHFQVEAPRLSLTSVGGQSAPTVSVRVHF